MLTLIKYAQLTARSAYPQSQILFIRFYAAQTGPACRNPRIPSASLRILQLPQALNQKRFRSLIGIDRPEPSIAIPQHCLNGL
jgi:hypothetical protein